MNFLEELERIRLKTPRLYNINIGSENSDYCTHSDKNKNCYLLFAANYNEDSYYGSIIVNSRDCVDCDFCQYGELCYECTDIDHSYNCWFSQELKNCSDIFFSYDCIGSQNCFGSAGLRQKKYYFQNQPLSKEEYMARVEAFFKDPDWKKNGLRMLDEAKLQVPHTALRIVQSENCQGEDVTKSRNCYACFGAHESQDCFYVQDSWRTKDCADMTFSDGSELCYECFSIGLGTYNCNFSNYIRSSSDLEYCDLCFNCKNCFGCVGLQSKEFYILNQPYSREEYFKKVAEIKSQLKEERTYGQHLSTTYKYEDTAAF
ncbi:MAG: hypothetical protein AAB588_03925 [Patescibacteria group bacterium]